MVSSVGQVEEDPERAPTEEPGVSNQGQGQRLGRGDGQHGGSQHDDVEILAHTQSAGGDGQGGDADDHGHDHGQLDGGDVQSQVSGDDVELQNAESVQQHGKEENFGDDVSLARCLFAGFQGALQVRQPRVPGQQARQQMTMTGKQDQNQTDGEHPQREQRQHGEPLIDQQQVIVRHHKDHGEQQHGKQAQQTVGENGRHGFGLAFFGLMGAVIGFQQVASGAAQQKAVEELADHGDLERASEGDTDPLCFQQDMPAPGSQQDGGSHTQQGKEEGERADQSDDFPEGFGAILPGDAPLFGAAQL